MLAGSWLATGFERPVIHTGSPHGDQTPSSGNTHFRALSIIMPNCSQGTPTNSVRTQIIIISRIPKRSRKVTHPNQATRKPITPEPKPTDPSVNARNRKLDLLLNIMMTSRTTTTMLTTMITMISIMIMAMMMSC